MPSQPLVSSWNFSPVFDLIESDPHNVGSSPLRPDTGSNDLPDGGGIGLGNFSKLYESLGMPADAAVPPLPPLDESETSASDDVLPSPTLEATQVVPKVVDGHFAQAKIVVPIKPPTLQATQDIPRAVDEQLSLADSVLPIDSTSTTKKQRRKLRRLAEKAHELQAFPKTLAEVLAKDDTKPLFDTPTKTSRAQSNVGAKIRPASPVPAPNLPAPPQTPSITPRPVLSKRSKFSAAPVTPQPQSNAQAPAQSRSVLLENSTIPFTTLKKPTPFQSSLAPQYLAELQPSQVSAVSSGLVPRTVRPVAPPQNSLHVGSQSLPLPTTPTPTPFPSRSHVIPGPAPMPLGGHATPLNRPTITLRSEVDRHFHLFEKILLNFPHERKWLIHPRQLVNEHTRAEGVHVFVDASNIMIGFKEMLRNHRVVQPYDLSFDSLALLMERRRPVAKRVLVGSHRESNPLPATQRLIETCKAVGYECNIQEQVFIAREESQKKKFFNDVSRFGWQKAIQKRSGSGSDSETSAIATPKTPTPQRWLEQGVDELLHLKMCQSILDTELPSTMVLATGDGAEAEMSDGFLAHVERALRRGWKVELITWKQQTNGGYKRRAFRQKWGEQFTIIELDEFLEDLIDTP